MVDCCFNNSFNANITFSEDIAAAPPPTGRRQPTGLEELDGESSEGEDYRCESEEGEVEADTEVDSNEVEDLANEVERMTMTTRAAAAKEGKLVLPSVQYVWTDKNKQQRVTIDYLLPSGTSTNQVKVEVADCSRWVSLKYTPPAGLYDERRLLLANRSRGGLGTLNSSSHKVTAMAAVVQNYKKMFLEEEVVLTHREKLPFRCDTNLCTEELPTGCEIYPLANEDETMRVEHKQHYLIYSVDLVSVEKPKKKMIAARMNLAAFGSPSDLGENPDATIAAEQRAAMEAMIFQQIEESMEKKKQELEEQQMAKRQQKWQQQQARELQQLQEQQQMMQQQPKGPEKSWKTSGRSSTRGYSLSGLDSDGFGAIGDDDGGMQQTENESSVQPITPPSVKPRGG